MHSLHAKRAGREGGRKREAEQEQEKRLLFHFASSLTAFALLIDALLGTYVLCELLYHLRPRSLSHQTRPCRLCRVAGMKKVQGVSLQRQHALL